MSTMPHADPVLVQVPERLDTPRLVLSCAQAGDGPAMNLAVNESLDHLRPWMNWAQQAPTLEQSEAIARRMQVQFLQRQQLAYLVQERGPDGRRGRVIGGAGLHKPDWSVRRFEIGYWLAPRALGRGLATEAVVALSRMAFEQLRARRLEIRTDVRNQASRAVAQRCGYLLEGVLRSEALDMAGEPTDTCVFGLVTLSELRGG